MKLLRTVAVAAGLTASITIPRPVQAQTQNAYQDYFQKFLEYQSALIGRKDVKGFWKTRTPDHVSIDIKGRRRNQKVYRERLAVMIRDLRAWDVKLKVGNVKVNGDNASATVSSGQSMIMWSPRLQRDITIQAQLVEDYTFRRIKGKWYESSNRERTARMWVEGREIPYNPSGPSE